MTRCVFCDLFVMSPHSNDFDRPLRLVDLIYQPVLNVDASRVGTRQISNEFFVGRRSLERSLCEKIEKTFCLWPEIGRRKFPRIYLRLFRKGDRPTHQPGWVEVFSSGSAMPLRMESRMPGIETK
jgi:hypothetical protein